MSAVRVRAGTKWRIDGKPRAERCAGRRGGGRTARERESEVGACELELWVVDRRGPGGGDGRDVSREAEVLQDAGGDLGRGEEGQDGQGVAAAGAGGDVGGKDALEQGGPVEAAPPPRGGIGVAGVAGGTGTARSRRRWADEKTPW